MKKLFIDHEWGVEIPIMRENGAYLKKDELLELGIDMPFLKKITLWSFSIQNEMNWDNPSDHNKYLPDYYYEFISKLQDDIIKNFEKYDIELVLPL